MTRRFSSREPTRANAPARWPLCVPQRLSRTCFGSWQSAFGACAIALVISNIAATTALADSRLYIFPADPTKTQDTYISEAAPTKLSGGAELRGILIGVGWPVPEAADAVATRA